MPGFPDKFMPFMDEPPPGSTVSTAASGIYGTVIKALRKVTERTCRARSRSRRNPG